MFSLIFGSYLLKKNRISDSQYDLILEDQKTTRVKLGLIAVAEKLLTNEQADEINQLQATMDKRFGDIAVEKGYLTDEQVGHLLSIQGSPYLIFTQSVVDQNIMTLEEMEKELAIYKEEYGFTDEDIEAIKSGDVDKIAPVFVKVPNDMYFLHTSLALRNINRFVTTEFYFEKGFMAKEYKNSHMAIQEIDGDHKVFAAFAGEDDALLYIANVYGDENFDAIDEDSYDAMCEFINVINGLFASKLSEDDIEVDMLPPKFKDNAELKSEEEFYVLPIIIYGRRIDYILGIDQNISVS